ncbi:MAG: signal peptidase II, partial [Clostridia bacterium]|nr:signal peptidase II [Clostridia bacterium]
MIFLVWEIIITLGVVFVDLLSKRLAETLLMPLPGYTFPLIENVIHFTYTRNTGAAFSMLEGQRTFFIIVASIAVVVMVA